MRLSSLQALCPRLTRSYTTIYLLSIHLSIPYHMGRIIDPTLLPSSICHNQILPTVNQPVGAATRGLSATD